MNHEMPHGVLKTEAREVGRSHIKGETYRSGGKALMLTLTYVKPKSAMFRFFS